jgi:endonuclease-3
MAVKKAAAPKNAAATKQATARRVKPAKTTKAAGAAKATMGTMGTMATTPPKATRPARPTRLATARGVSPDTHHALYDRLLGAYPDAHCALDHRNAYELLVATILSAQCTDRRVNMVTPALFAAYPTPAALAAARQEDVERLVQSTGFFRGKAKNLIAMATALVERHGGEVPCDMDALTALPGVGRKTANVILGNAFGVNEGIVVDTHVGRLAQRLGLARTDDPVKIEQALLPLFARDRWTMLAHLLIEHGRQTCDARKPKCASCCVRDLCPSAG